MFIIRSRLILLPTVIVNELPGTRWPKAVRTRGVLVKVAVPVMVGVSVDVSVGVEVLVAV